MPDTYDIFNNMPTVMMLIEIPSEVYTGMKEGYENGIRSGLHENTMGKWTGLLVCKGIQSVYEDQERAKAAAERWVNFKHDDDFAVWLRDRVDNEESGDRSKVFREVFDRYMAQGRL